MAFGGNVRFPTERRLADYQRGKVGIRGLEEARRWLLESGNQRMIGDIEMDENHRELVELLLFIYSTWRDL